MLNILDLFSGIGGFSLGLERTGGFRTAAFCEQNTHAASVLRKHWPHVPVYEDVKSLGAARLAADSIGRIDVICGGFPCQDISLSGSGAGLAGERSGLWFEFHRLIGEIRPTWVIVENVSALRSRGLDEVLRGLAAIGYDAEWHCIPASAVGAPHRRDRIWIVAYPSNWPQPRQSGVPYSTGALVTAGAGTDGRDQFGNYSQRSILPGRYPVSRCSTLVADAHKPRLEIKLHGEAGEQPAVERTHAWTTEPDVGRVAYGVPARVDRITRLGNAVVPQIPEAIGRAILRADTV